ncbi:hypothetical protein [Micromonospora sp. SL4-19]|uniref:hypothetical protein n=1 Tax=Micromonospora sp. SL4-19 TaxID=3399129 RepID=UPI003A4E042B
MRKTLLDRAAGHEIDLILTHPKHEWARRTLTDLIGDLRSCRHDDLYDFQQRLFEIVLGVEEHRAQVRRVITRLRRGQKIPAGAPELGIASEPLNPESWLLEEEVLERVWRQLKSVGDALAWRAFSFDRRIIVALSRGEPAGPMFGKTGLDTERRFVDEAWRDRGEFVLHHDLTSALRIADVSIFQRDGSVLLQEIKTNQRYRVRKQDKLVIDTSRALADGGALPGGYFPVCTEVPYKTNLTALREVLWLAHERQGIQGARLPYGRALLACSLYTAPNRYSPDSFNQTLARQVERYRRKTGIRSADHSLTFCSLDRVARAPAYPPWAIYPVTPDVAASLTADAMFFYVLLSPDAILGALSDVGVDAQWLQRLDGSEDFSKPLLRVARNAGRQINFTTLNPDAFLHLALELIDIPSWVRQVALTLDGGIRDVRPWPCFKEEHRTWA